MRPIDFICLTVKNLAILLTTLLLCVVIFSLAKASFDKVRYDRKSESVCLAIHVSNGVERKEIYTSGGKCYLNINVNALNTGGI